MKKCAYCGRNLTKQFKSKEHIIPDSLIKLFPEQNITFTENKCYKDNTGQTISDVCTVCNNEFLSRLDTYGSNLIKCNFRRKFKKDDNLKMIFDFNKLSRWLLKVAYNVTRMEKNSCNWFKRNIDYINGTADIKDEVSIFAGLHVDMDPQGEENSLYLPLSICSDLHFYDTGILSYEGLMNGKIIKSSKKPLNFKEIYKSYSFRFASARFVLILWKSQIDISNIRNIEGVIETLFPYKKISNNEVVLKRANDNLSGRFGNLIIGNIGMNIMDELVDSTIPNLEETQKYFTEFQKTRTKKEKEIVGELIINSYNNR